eukprot:EC788664.1.p1 GENE.EC788664.1~~EC788664.1.p1  ORF type:complete len:149 (+),score=48.15 EC788664.1:31-477(+)
MDRVLFNDMFRVVEVDPEGKKFEKVSRLKCKSDGFEADLLLDVNIELYPINQSDKFTLALAETLDLDGTADSGVYDPLLGTDQKPSLMDSYEYVMYGKVFKYTAKDKDLTVSVYASFGGLLMKLTGDERNLEKIRPDSNIYLLMRKTT